MFKRILIANRGEIACRIIRTCKKLGISTIAVYSQEDANAVHVKMADEAFLIGGPHVNESYLNMERIIHVAKESKSDAIHPGYGLLSENPQFAKRCDDEGIVFIGPSSDSIALMGSKIEARKIMQKKGIRLIPGTTKPLKDIDEACDIAKNIGYPLMLKASAGGGGIGMQVVYNEDELKKTFSSNQKRAKEFFGNGSMYIEKYINNPRHIEIQILADQSGNTVYLGERECSIQRRHQKVIEEAPSSFLDEKTREEMGKTRIAKEINYFNAGTIEFLVDNRKKIYFLEMNTRLQVEHPITEEITNIDIVEEQIRIAGKEKLDIKQEDINLIGHAIEARIYAEDPITHFPSPGEISKLDYPTKDYIGNELAVEKGSYISPFYDPMIGKLVVKAKDREQAIERILNSLYNYKVEGIKTNIPLLVKAIDHNAFRGGNITTEFLENYVKHNTVN